MPRASYQYGTSPRKYEPEYTPRTSRKTTKTAIKRKAEPKKSDAQKRIQKQRAQKVAERKNKIAQVIVVLTIFGMLLALSYREITIMEMFNQKKNLENQLSTIQKENGQIEKSIREVESTLNWNDIYKTATESLGMQVRKAIPVDLEKADNVETNNTFIKEENTSIIEKIVGYFVNR